MSFAPVEKAWEHSSLILDISEKGLPLTQSDTPIWMTIFVCTFLILAILFFDRLKTACEISIALLFKKNMIKETLDNTYGMVSLNSSSLMILPLFSFILLTTNRIPHTYIFILATLLILVIFKAMVVKMIEWVSSTDKSLDTLISFFNAFIFVTTLASTPMLILKKFFIISDLIFIIYISIITFFFYVLMILRSRQIILDSRFSHFFCFLYLCALEIIPFALAIRVIIF